VGSFGEVFVVDWGVARTMDGALQHIAGTPHYMAPEQSERGGDGLDVRTDVFALGRILQDLMPAKPPRPLAAIARKAAAAEPSGRYPDVLRLAADVNLFLDGMPVSAYRDTVLEQLSRYARQNQVLLLLIGTYLVVKFLLFFLSPALK